MQAVRGGSSFYVQGAQSHILRGIWRVPYLPQMIARQIEQRTGGHMSRASGCDRASAKRESSDGSQGIVHGWAQPGMALATPGVIILVGIDPGAVRQATARIQVGAQASGRELRDLHLVLWVPCAVSDRAPAKAAVKAHVARVAAHPLPFALDEPARQVLAEIRRAYNYYQHMEPQASQAQVIPDCLVDRFAIAGTPAECRARVEALQGSGIEQIAIVPYGVGEGDRAATLRGFAAAVRGLTP